MKFVFLLTLNLFLTSQVMAACEGTNFFLSKSSFAKLPLNLKHEDVGATFEIGDKIFEFNVQHQCWQTLNEVDPSDDDEEASEATTSSCRNVTIPGKAQIETSGNKLMVYSVDVDGKRNKNLPYLEVKSNQVMNAHPSNQPQEISEVVTAFDGAQVGKIETNIPYQKKNPMSNRKWDLRGMNIEADDCAVISAENFGDRKVVKDEFCHWGLGGKKTYSCDGKKYCVSDAVTCSSGTYENVFCSEAYCNTGTECKGDTSDETTKCLAQYNEEQIKKSTDEACNWGSPEESVYECDGKKYYHGSPLCNLSGKHKEIFCSEEKSKNGKLCEADESSATVKCQTNYLESKKSKKVPAKEKTLENSNTNT